MNQTPTSDRTSKMETLNPYVYAFRVFAKRLRWDLNPESWRSRRLLRNLRDTKGGRTCVIICNGPSLNRVNLDKLSGVDTIGLNKINLLFDKINFRPNYMVCVDHNIYSQNSEFLNRTDIPLFLDSRALECVKSRPNVRFVHMSAERKFGGDISMSIQIGGTVTNVALQIAFYLGYSRVCLVGCDHNYPTIVHQDSSMIRSDHFIPGYYQKGQPHSPPDLPMVEMSMHRILKLYQENNRELYNCTDGGKLEILPRLALDAFLKGAC